MLPSKSRSGSSDMSQRGSPSGSNPKAPSSKSIKGTPTSSDSSDSKSLKGFERKSSTKATPLHEKMQQQLSQLQEELKKEKEEKSKALEYWTEIKGRVQMLEKEAVKAKESERKMLESLVSQTKQLEQTKISLEEAKLEISSLQKSNKSLESSALSASRSSRNLERSFRNNNVSNAIQDDEEIRILRNELRLAMEAEEKSKKAMDDLAVALKEVTTEANQVKQKLSATETELEKVRIEAEQLKASLESAEEKCRVASEESETLKLELEESVSAWNEKEKGFINCIKMSEEEINKAKQENMKLIESQRVTRDENSRLRDILKQAVNEATVVKDALQITRNENSQLKDLVSEKDKNLQSIKQEYECIKVSEAASQDSLKELKDMLAATSTVNTSKSTSPFEVGSFQQSGASSTDAKTSDRMGRFSSGRWKGEKTQIQNGRRHSIGEPSKLKDSSFDLIGSAEQKDLRFASLSNVSDMKAASSISISDLEDEFDHIDGTHLEGMEHSMKQKKKRPILRRFGDLLRRKKLP
ncbi:uncharacterized protein [Typha angustifolia]|uniref:uncharacterized protein n=1 Tax=Typha angustifolia TaxID=59011 RepID=UPI003C2E9E2B